MRKKLLKNFPVFTGRKIKMSLLSVRVIITIIFLIVISQFYMCKKNQSIIGEEFVGEWELEQLIIDGHDTTTFIKSDTNCYGYTKFFDNYHIGQIPVYNAGAHFYCAQKGLWDYYRLLNINYAASSVSVGPYLAGEALDWQVLEKSKNRLRLYIVYHNMQCYLTYKRKS